MNPGMIKFCDWLRANKIHFRAIVADSGAVGTFIDFEDDCCRANDITAQASNQNLLVVLGDKGVCFFSKH